MKYIDVVPDFFQKVFEIERKRSKKIIYGLLIFLLLSFFLGIIAGIYVIEYQPAIASQTIAAFGQQLAPIFNLVLNGQFGMVALLIFLNNFRVALIITLSGLTIFLLFVATFYVAGITGFFIGISLTSFSNVNIFNSAGLLLVGGLEFVALTLAAIEGFYLGASLFFPHRLYMKITRREALKKALKDAAYIYALIILILTIAALMETAFIFFEVQQISHQLSFFNF